MPRKSHHRRNQATARIRSAIKSAKAAVVCRASSSHSARSIRPVLRQIREPTGLDAPSIRHPHHHRLNPAAIDRFEHGLARRTLLRTPPLHRGAPGKEQRHAASRRPMPRVAMRTDDAALSVRRSAIEGTLPQAPSTFGPGSPQPIDRPSVGRARSPHRRPRRRDSPSPALRARLNHPFDPTPLGFAFSTRRLQQRLEIAERCEDSSCPSPQSPSKRTHELTFHRIDMHTPVERRPLNPRDLLRETKVTTSCGAAPLAPDVPSGARGLSVPPTALTRPSLTQHAEARETTRRAPSPTTPPAPPSSTISAPELIEKAMAVPSGPALPSYASTNPSFRFVTSNMHTRSGIRVTTPPRPLTR